jgi:hypothetical protein
MPSPAISVLLAVEHVCQRLVDGLPLGERGIAVERRADEWVAHFDAAVEGAHQARQLCCIECVRLDAQRAGRLEDCRQAAGVLRRDQQEQPLRRRRQATRALEIDALDLRAPGERSRQRRATGKLVLAQKARELDQRQRTPRGALDEAVAHLGRKCRLHSLGEQLRRRLGPEALEPELRQAASLEAPRLTVARREEHHDALRLEPPRRKCERVSRRAVEPLRIVDHAQQRLLLGRLREEVEYRHADQEAVVDGLP